MDCTVSNYIRINWLGSEGSWLREGGCLNPQPTSLDGPCALLKGPLIRPVARSDKGDRALTETGGVTCRRTCVRLYRRGPHAALPSPGMRLAG